MRVGDAGSNRDQGRKRLVHASSSQSLPPSLPPPPLPHSGEDEEKDEPAAALPRLPPSLPPPLYD